MADTKRKGFRAPLQRRSRETLHDIEAAVADLLAGQAPWEVSVHEIVDRAGTSVGAFYTRFDDKQVAFGYAHDRFWRGVEEHWRAFLDPSRWEGAGTAQIAATVIRVLVRSLLADAPRLRGFLRLAATSSDPTLRYRIEDLDRFIAGRMGSLLEARAERSHPGQIRERAEEGFRVVLSSTREAVLFHPAVEQRSPDARSLTLALTRTFCRCVGLEPCPQSYGQLLSACVRTRPEEGP